MLLLLLLLPPPLGEVMLRYPKASSMALQVSLTIPRGQAAWPLPPALACIAAWVPAAGDRAFLSMFLLSETSCHRVTVPAQYTSLSATGVERARHLTDGRC